MDEVVAVDKTACVHSSCCLVEGLLTASLKSRAKPRAGKNNPACLSARPQLQTTQHGMVGFSFRPKSRERVFLGEHAGQIDKRVQTFDKVAIAIRALLNTRNASTNVAEDCELIDRRHFRRLAGCFVA